jgi:hypothetical protein
MTTLKMRTSIAWWLKPYVYTLAVFCVITGAVPDEAKLNRVIMRAIRVKVLEE